MVKMLLLKPLSSRKSDITSNNVCLLDLLDQKKSFSQGFICAGIKLSTTGNLLQLKVNLYIIYHIDRIPL